MEYRANAIGMSGLLVKSTVIMRENLEELTRLNINIPVFLGGAALTRKYVEEDCTKAYGTGGVAYAPDAFDGLNLMGTVIEGKFESHLASLAETHSRRPKKKQKQEENGEQPGNRPVDLKEIKLKRAELAKEVDVPSPPFWGPRLVENISMKSLPLYLNETMLFHFQWGFKKGRRAIGDLKTWVDEEIRPILHRMIQLVIEEKAFEPKAAYGYWKAASEGDSVVLFDKGGNTEVGRFTFPRQNRKDGLSITDFFRDIDCDKRDLIALQVVTIGQRASDIAREWFSQDKYQDYLYLHGLGVEITEALAEYIHKRIREELGFAHLDDQNVKRMLRQGYRGARYSFGYPACPNLEDQRILLDLLDAERLGIEMSEEEQLHPEQSTSAIVVHHPQAKYFSV
jgi:5-methyltetrahydrofolate--homocysteine methyltransferase